MAAPVFAVCRANTRLAAAIAVAAALVVRILRLIGSMVGPSPLAPAGRRVPSLAVCLLPELHAADVRLREVLRILEHVGDDEILGAFVGERRPVFGEHRVP